MDTIAISVRRAIAADAPALTALVNEAFAVERDFVEGDRATVAEIAAMTRDGVFLVLEAAGGLAAAIHVERRGEGAAFGLLAVRPALQGLGLGERMVRIAEAMAEATGAGSISLRIVNLREDLGRWYRGLGYREVGTTPCADPRTTQPCHFVEMHKALGAGGASASHGAHASA